MARLLHNQAFTMARMGCGPRMAGYSTVVPKKAAGPFTSNKQIVSPMHPSTPLDQIHRTLVYIGPFSETIRRYKMTASLFGMCGLLAVPALISTGQVPALAVAMTGISAVFPALYIHWSTRQTVARLIVYEDIKTVERQRRHQHEAAKANPWLGIETLSFFGRRREHALWVSDLQDVSTSAALVWRDKKQGREFALERSIVEADPYLVGLGRSQRS